MYPIKTGEEICAEYLCEKAMLEASIKADEAEVSRIEGAIRAKVSRIVNIEDTLRMYGY